MSDLDDFIKLVTALKPWRHQLVFVGGWAYRLYREHPLADRPDYELLRTQDADIAIADNAKLEESIQKSLLEAGFHEELSGNHCPPVSHYTFGDQELGFYAEFLTPLRGSDFKRNGKRDATVSKAGITAQKLRHLEVLLIDPWEVTVPTIQVETGDEPIKLQLPNPVSFIIQKVLIHENRPPDKRAQDVLYMHDTLELFGAQLPALADLWATRVAGALTSRQRRNVIGGAKQMFSTVTDTIRRATRIPQDRSLTPERMQAFCEQAMDQVLR